MEYPTTGITEFNTINETSVSVSSTSSTSVLAARNTRVFTRLTNKGLYAIFLGLGTTATKTRGIRLGKDETYEFNREKIWRGAINAISNTAQGAQALVISEGYTS